VSMCRRGSDSKPGSLSPPRMKLLGAAPDVRAAAAAAAAATVIIALQLAGKATRDAFFLSTFGVTSLPAIVIVSAIISGILAVALARIMARSQPARLVPRLFVLSAVLLLAEWGLSVSARRPAAILVYLHLTALGAILVSGFWAIVNERFDPRTARRTIGRITAGGSIGGLLGGILPERVGAALPLTAMLPILALITLMASVLVLGVDHGRPAQPWSEIRDEQPIPVAGQVLRGSRYLMELGLLVALMSSAEGVLDYVFKARASAATLSGEQLLRFFAAFYTATALIAILVQVTAVRPLLGRLGIARSASLLPAGVSAGALAAFAFPGILSIMVARGVEVVLRSSFFRAAYELLFTPVAPAEKRATKLLLDVGAARVGDVAGATLILVALAVSGTAARLLLLALTVLLSGIAVLVARRLHAGYVAALAGSIHRQTGEVPDPTRDDATAWLQTVGGFDLTELRARLATGVPYLAEPVSPSLGPSESPLQQAIRSGDATAVRRALVAQTPKPDQVETVIDLLAWDAVAPAAIHALGEVAGTSTEIMLRHLLDPDEDFAIRRRLVNALAACRSPAVFEGLFQALRDRRFEVRYRAGRALSGMAGKIRGVEVDRDRVVTLVLKELEVERAVWEGRYLIDLAEEESSPMEAEVLQERVSRSLEHLFTLLSLILPRETLRLAFHALHTGDTYLRNTALEYLETILPDRVWERLSQILEPGQVSGADRARGSAEALQELLASRESISLALAEARRRGQRSG
jgi:ATP:ADP antiporter, AAA family